MVKAILLDASAKGNLLYLYFGPKLADAWGDDWDDKPYECNCGIVYPRYVSGGTCIAVPWEWDIFEPADFYMWGSPFCRNDFKGGEIPLFFASRGWFPAEKWMEECKRLPALYMGMTWEEVKERFIRPTGAKIIRPFVAPSTFNKR